MGKIRLNARAAVGSAALLSMLSAQAQAIDNCALPNEQAALDTRVLQSELVVAALSCGTSSQYNGFVQKFESELVALGGVFRNYFARIYGPNGEDRMDQAVTRMANIAEVRSMGLGPQYCDYEAQVFATLQGVAPAQLAAFAAENPYVGDHDIRPCPVQVQAQSPNTPVAASPDPASADKP